MDHENEIAAQQGALALVGPVLKRQYQELPGCPAHLISADAQDTAASALLQANMDHTTSTSSVHCNLIG